MIKNEYELIEVIKSETNVIIYGAKNRAQMVIERIKVNDLQPHIFISVSNTYNEFQTINGIPVQEIQSLVDLADCSVVVIATQSKYHDEIEKNVRKLGFKNVIRINDLLFKDIRLNYDIQTIFYRMSQTSITQTQQQFMQHQTMNQIRLNHLRDKVRIGQKVKVIFLLTSVAKFSYSSVYRAIEKKGLFDVSIFLFEEYFNDNEFMSDIGEMKEFAKQLESDGFNIIWGYDDKDTPKSIEQFSPDIIFYNAPYLVNRNADQLIFRIICNYLSCYIPYGIEVANSFEYHFEHKNILPAWIHFISTRQAYDLCGNNALSDGVNTVLSGHPLFDEYIKKAELKIPDKLKNGNKIVIYAPHWSVATWHNTSTFHIHYEYFASLLEKYPEINFVFKPHPRLGPEIRVREAKGENVIPTYREYEEYCKVWNDSPNGIVINDSSYIDLFQASDCLITDSYSFIASWLPTEKPCILLMNPKGPLNPYKYYYDFVRPIIDSYYTCKNESDIDDIFKKVVIYENDDKIDCRKEQKNKFIYNFGHSGEFIADYIERQLKS
jgi:hypothetical protein